MLKVLAAKPPSSRPKSLSLRMPYKEGLRLEKTEIDRMLDAAVEEIEYSLTSNKDKETKEFYLKNAIRFIKSAKERINS